MAHVLDSDFDGDSTVDNPHVRADQTCPLCRGHKDIGLLACWPCYRRSGLRIASGESDSVISRRDAYLGALTCS